MLVLIGATLAGPGLYLAALGGSLYYALAGFLVCAAGVLVWRSNPRSAFVYAAVVLLTVIWAYWEVGPQVWLLVPRIFGVGVLTLGFTVPTVARTIGLSRRAKQLLWLTFAVSIGALVVPFAIGLSAENSVLPAGGALTALAEPGRK